MALQSPLSCSLAGAATFPPPNCSCSGKLILSSSLLRRSSSSLSWGSSFPGLSVFLSSGQSTVAPLRRENQLTIIQAAWTRRSRKEAAERPNKKSWKQRTDMYMRPFLLNIFFSNRFIHAKVMHRGTSKVVSVASTNAKDLRNTLPSLVDEDACRVVGRLIAERSKEADVYAVAYEVKRGERIEGKLGIVIDTIKENGIMLVD